MRALLKCHAGAKVPACLRLPAPAMGCQIWSLLKKVKIGPATKTTWNNYSFTFRFYGIRKP